MIETITRKTKSEYKRENMSITEKMIVVDNIKSRILRKSKLKLKQDIALLFLKDSYVKNAANTLLNIDTILTIQNL